MKWMQEMEISMEQKPVNKHASKIALQQGEGGRTIFSTV